MRSLCEKQSCQGLAVSKATSIAAFTSETLPRIFTHAPLSVGFVRRFESLRLQPWMLHRERQSKLPGYPVQMPQLPCHHSFLPFYPPYETGKWFSRLLSFYTSIPCFHYNHKLFSTEISQKIHIMPHNTTSSSRVYLLDCLFFTIFINLLSYNHSQASMQNIY